MMRRRNHQPAMSASECFYDMRSFGCSIDYMIDKLEGSLDVEVDEFHRIMRIINYKLDFWWKKLQESGQAWDPEQFHIYKMLSVKFRDVHFNLRDGGGPDYMTPTRMGVMGLLKDISLILDPVTEGSSLVTEIEMIARPKELEDIASLLVSEHSNASSAVSVFPILGEPGSGKSSLVYFLFHRHLVKQHFNRRIWIRWELISGVRSVQEILQIINRRFGFDLSDKYAKYMVVVEDLSNEGDEKWFDLLEPLLSAFSNCKIGTKIIVTSNSKSLESHVLLQLPLAKGAPHLLKPPHHDDSLAFFKSIAFRGFTEEDKDPHLNDIALAIFDKCGSNVRVIRTVASILSSQPPSKWRYFNEVVLNLPNLVEHILSLLDLMQHRLFFNYHSLFPLEYTFSKEDFYQLWDAQEEVIEPLKATLEKLLGNYFLFKCCKRDKNGFLVKYRVHVLVHEIAKHLAQERYHLIEDHLEEVRPLIIRHVSFIIDSSFEAPYWLSRAEHLKSLLILPRKSGEIITCCDLKKILKDLGELRALDLACVNSGNYLDTIGKLTQLRYLRLGVSVKYLPECITYLPFLQTLDLRHSKIRELPAGFHKLCHLKHLYTGDRLIDMPPKFEKLTKLQTLDVFIVGQHNGLDALANFTNLAGTLKIYYQNGWKGHVLRENTSFLQDKKLHELSLEWRSSNVEQAGENIIQKEDTMELELLQLPFNLKRLIVRNWKGERFPLWAMDHFSSLLDNLVFIHIVDCRRCKHLPSFSKLSCLKFLELWGLIALDWIEISDDNSLVSAKTPYFPSLEHLSLLNLPQLKGWSRMEEQHASCSTLSVLSDLRVSSCPELLALPLMPNLKSLEADNCQGDFLQRFLNAHASQVSSRSSSSALPILQSLYSLSLTNMAIPECLACLTTIEELSLCWLYDLRILPESIGHLLQLRRLVIRYVPNLADLPESLAGLPALKHVEIRYCPRLKQVPTYFSDLKSLQRLEIKECVKLERRCQERDGEDWPLIQHITEVILG